MKILISPAKSLNFDIEIERKDFSTPNFIDESKILIDELKKFSQSQISTLMKISENLAQINYQRFQDFKTPFTCKNAKPALYFFNGDVYEGIDVENYNEKQIQYAQNNLRILSGLYGILKPLDLIQAYRLEMSTKLKNKNGKNLYEFWQEKLTNYLNQEEENLIINLASSEYFQAINKEKIKAKIVNIIFKEKKGKEFKIVGIFAKKARGLMVDYLIKNNVKNLDEIKKFNSENYKFNQEFSEQENLVFTR